MASPPRLSISGLCGRHHDLANLDIIGTEDGEARLGISLFDAVPRSLPYELEMVERHPLGSQAFIPMAMTSFLVISAPDEGDKPGKPQAFLSAPGQAINFHRNVWHGVLTPLESPGLFAVVDRIGSAKNLQEYWFDEPYLITSAE